MGEIWKDSIKLEYWGEAGKNGEVLNEGEREIVIASLAIRYYFLDQNIVFVPKLYMSFVFRH